MTVEKTSFAEALCVAAQLHTLGDGPGKTVDFCIIQLNPIPFNPSS
jgi:hypothetical protein